MIKLTEITLTTRSTFGEYSAKYSLNEYFVAHPEMVLGRFEERKAKWGDELTVIGGDAEAVAADMLRLCPVSSVVLGDQSDASLSTAKAATHGLPSTRTRSESTSETTTAPSEAATLAQNIYVATKQALSSGDAAALHTLYTQFTSRFGSLRGAFANGTLMPSREGALLLALETAQGRPSALLLGLHRQPTAPLKIESLSDALAICNDKHGTVNIHFIGELLAKTPEAVLDGLLAQNLVFNAPLGCIKPGLVMSNDYLTGDIGTKLAVAKRAAQHDSTYARNVEALTAVLPPPLGPEDIIVGLGAEWVPEEIYRDWLYSLFPGESWGINVTHKGGKWGIAISNPRLTSANVGIATPRVSAVSLIESALNNMMPIVYDTVTVGDGSKREVRNERATMEAQARALELRTRFASWVFSGALGKSGETGEARSARLCALYNERFNTIVPRDFSGDYLTFEGLATHIKGKAYHLKPRQLRGVAKMLHGGTRDRSAYLVYPPGFGKTDPAIAGAVKLTQLGLTRKTLFAVPKSALEQWHHRFLAMFPGLADEILCASDRMFGLHAVAVGAVGAAGSGGAVRRTSDAGQVQPTSALSRQIFLARIATGGWRYILVSHELLRDIVLSQESFDRFLARELTELRTVLREAEYSSVANRDATKQARRSLRSRESALQRASVAHKKRWATLCEGGKSPVSWEDCGLDHLIIDEAHAFKNLAITTRMERIAGLPTGDGSSRAYDCYVKCQHVLERGGRVTALSGTPLTNTICEAFVWLRMLQPKLLEHVGLTSFDSFASVFTEAYPSVELDCVGKYRTQTRLRFHNVPELLNLLSEAWDFVREQT